MSIASELQNYEDGLGDAYDAAQTMGAVMPAQKNMNNLDATILTIPQPTVNDGTLTIQQNGTTLGTFTANQASNTTVNITGGGGSNVTVFYGYIVAGTNKHFYSDQAMTTAITGQDFADAIDDPDQIVVIYDVDGDYQHVVVTGEGWTAYVVGDSGKETYRLDAQSAASTDFTITKTDFQEKLTAGSNITISSNTISATDTTYSDFVGATSSVAGSAGLVPAPATTDTAKYLRGDGVWASTPAPELVEMVYGESNAWAKFIAAYQAKCIVYCRASSNTNPATGAKTRKAFMAYVNNEDNPTQVEFQYYRSVSSHSASQQGDQVFVYLLKNDNSWSVSTREASSKIVAGTNMTSSYSSGTLTLNATDTTYSDFTGATSGTAGAHGLVPAPAAGDEAKVLCGDGTWVNQPTVPTVNDATLTITQNGTSAGTFTANASSNVTIALTDTTYSDMAGATSGAAGTSGLVPAPSAGDESKVLSGAGTWVNQPSVPTVNDGTLTIQHNGTSVQTFTANQSANATANIQTIYSVDAIDTTAVTPTVTADMIDWSTMRATLWANPDPTTSYAGTSFTVAGLSNWDYIAVIARTHTSQNQMNIFKVEYGNGGVEISFADNGNTMDRSITWTGNTVTVSNGRLNASTANDRCVPVKIIGMMY